LCHFIAYAALFLQEVVQRWQSYTPEQQRGVFEAALVAASEGAWQDLEEHLQLALELAAV
jgi:hypothetical protein